MILRNTHKNRISTSASIFDPELATLLDVDKDENFVSISYDFNENGHPLYLPIPVPITAGKAEFGIKVTGNNVLANLLVYDYESEVLIDEFCNEVGDLEFDVRFTPEEEKAMLYFIARSLIKLAGKQQASE